MTSNQAGDIAVRDIAMTRRILLFTQPGCLSCEVTRIFLEAKEAAFEERDIIADPAARQEMIDDHGSTETPTLVFISDDLYEVVVGFDPTRLDQLLDGTPSSDSVTGS
jgi:glutaredoxin